MSRVPFQNPGVWTLSTILIVPFLLYGLGLLEFIYFVASLIVVLYLLLLLLNFEIGFLTLIFIRSSLDYLKNFGGGSTFNVAAVVSLLLIVLGLFYTLYKKVNPFRFEDVFAFLFFIGICAISVGYSPNKVESLSDWLRLLSVFSVYLLTRIIFVSERQIKVALNVILLSSLIPILAGYLQFITGQGLVQDGGQGRVVGTFLHPNAFATYLLVILIFCMAQILEKSRFLHRGLLSVLFILAFGIFIMTYSRGAWIVFVLAALLMGIMRYRKILGLLPVVLVAAVFLVPGIRDRMLDALDPTAMKGRSAWEWRVDTWGEIAYITQQKPVWGHGLSMVENQFGILTHNDYLRLLAETGMVGLMAYIFLASSLFGKTVSDYRKSASDWSRSFQVGLLAVILGFLVRQFADNTLRNTVVMVYFWIFVALVRNIGLLDQVNQKQALEYSHT